jgi:tRNA-intron endonuclease
MDEQIIADDTKLHDKSCFGSLHNGTLHLSSMEALYLVERNMLAGLNGKNQAMTTEQLIRRFKRKENNFLVRYTVFADLRKRGYIVKTALKFGADFRVYDKGVKPGQDHALWVVYPVSEHETLTWQDFSAKNRVAHSTRKRLMIGVVDEERDVTYYEIQWKRP